MDDLTKQAIQTLASALGDVIDGKLATSLQVAARDANRTATERLESLSDAVTELRERVTTGCAPLEALLPTVEALEAHVIELVGSLNAYAGDSRNSAQQLSNGIQRLENRVDHEVERMNAVVDGLQHIKSEVSILPKAPQLESSIGEVQGAIVGRFSTLAEELVAIRAAEEKTKADCATHKTELARLRGAHEEADARNRRIQSSQHLMITAILILSGLSLIAAVVSIFWTGG